MNKFGYQWPASLNCEAFNTESCEHVSPPSLTSDVSEDVEQQPV